MAVDLIDGSGGQSTAIDLPIEKRRGRSVAGNKWFMAPWRQNQQDNKRQKQNRRLSRPTQQNKNQTRRRNFNNVTASPRWSPADFFLFFELLEQTHPHVDNGNVAV